MDLLDRLIGHDFWTTRHLLVIASAFEDEVLDRTFDLGHGSLRATFTHMIRNMEVWTDLMLGRVPREGGAVSMDALIRRLDAAGGDFRALASDVRRRGAWDDTWLDTLDDPPRWKSFGGAIAHVLTHDMHHRGQILFMLRRLGVPDVPEGDLLSWEHAAKADDDAHPPI